MLNPKSYMEEDWRPTVGCLQRLTFKYPRVDLEYYIEESRDHALANGKMYRCFDAYFRNWIRRAGNFGQLVMLRAPKNKYVHENADVVAIGTIHAARDRGIVTAGKTERQLNSDIWDHDQSLREKESNVTQQS